jgi:hypothetical protein
MIRAYGLYLGAREHPSSAVLDRASAIIVDPTETSHRRHGVEPNGSVPLWQRRGVACLAPDREGHAGLNGCEPWGHTGPLARECSVQDFVQ